MAQQISYDPQDMIMQPLYDTAIVAPGPTEFFAAPVGQGLTLFGSGPKHFGDTNMYLANQIPAGQQFAISSIYAEPIDHPVEAGAYLELTLGAKVFLTIPHARAAVTVVVTDEATAYAVRLLELVRGVDPAARAMLLGSMGVTIGFDISARRLVVSATERLGLRFVMPKGARARIVRVYLNGQLGRPVQ